MGRAVPDGLAKDDGKIATIAGEIVAIGDGKSVVVANVTANGKTKLTNEPESSGTKPVLPAVDGKIADG